MVNVSAASGEARVTRNQRGGAYRDRGLVVLEPGGPRARPACVWWCGRFFAITK